MAEVIDLGRNSDQELVSHFFLGWTHTPRILLWVVGGEVGETDVTWILLYPGVRRLGNYIDCFPVSLLSRTEEGSCALHVGRLVSLTKRPH